MYTTSFAFFEAIWEAGITHCFVNLGSDHPSIVEAFVKGQNEKPNDFPKLITCPNEMVALSMADGYARLTGKPQCVIVHVDVGTQGLGAAVHDASLGRCPVLIFAGLSPYTIEGEHRGSRTEYIHWIQDVPDQRQIVSQYCRYTGEIKSGKNVKQMVNRALSFAMSDPKGPVYLLGAREVMEQDIEPYTLDQSHWRPIEPSALSISALQQISEALAHASHPLVITGYSGRNHQCVNELVQLANTIKGLRVLDTGGSDMCFPASHPGWLGLRYGVDPSIEEADAILCLDVDVPWIPTQCKPKSDCKIFHVDSDPLKKMMPVFYIPAVGRWQVSSSEAVRQLKHHLNNHSGLQSVLSDSAHVKAWDDLLAGHKKRLTHITSLAIPSAGDTFGASFLISEVRKACPKDTIWIIEAVTSTAFVADAIQATLPGSWINCGGGGLGWSGGAALGVKLASRSRDWHGPGFQTPPSSSTHDSPQSEHNRAGATTGIITDARGKPSFVCQIVGDGTYLFSIPSSVYWISARYNLPILTIILNNSGWNAPKRSLLLVHPDGEGSRATNEELNISFTPSPDYAGIAVAASGGSKKCCGLRVKRASEVGRVLAEAVKAVEGGRSAVVDCQLDGGVGAYDDQEAGVGSTSG